MKDGTIVAFSTEFNLKGIVKYPFRYLIQLATGSEIEHVGIVCGGYLYEATGSKGVIKTKLTDKLRSLESYVKVKFFKLKKPLTKQESTLLEFDLERQFGKKYSFDEALATILDRIIPSFIRKKRKANTKKQFCSKLCAYAYRNLSLISSDILPRDLNPEEFIKLIIKRGLVTLK